MNKENCQYCHIEIPFEKDPDRKIFKWHLADHPEPNGVPEKDKTEKIREDKLQDEFMAFWDENKYKLSLGNYSDEVTRFWLQKLEEQKQEMMNNIMRFEITARAEDNPLNKEKAEMVSELWEKWIKLVLLQKLD